MKNIKPVLIVIIILFIFVQSIPAQNIFEAIKEGDIKKIERMLANNPKLIHLRDKNSGGTPLHLAALCGFREMIKFFIEKGIKPNIKDNNGSPPLIWAIFGKSIKAIDELIKHGADLNPPIRIGRSVLHIAAANANGRVIDYLIQKGVKPNTKSYYGNTPLFWAINARKNDNVKALIQHGANLDIINNDGHTPVSFAVSKNYTGVVEALVENGIDIKKQNTFGDTHLHAAAYSGFKEMVELLLSKGVDPNIANNKGITALDLAIHREYLEVQQLLRSKNANTGKGKMRLVQFPEIKKIGSGIKNPLKATVIYDNYVHKKGMEADWGVSFYIEGTKKRILFDTGTKEDLFIDNFNKLDLDHKKIDMVVISHEHGDHTGGLFEFLEMNHKLPVILPFSFSYRFVSKIESYGAKVLPVKDPVEICKNVYLSGEIGQRIKEQSMAINTKNGLVIICGCSHPGIINIIKHFKATLKRNVYMVFGGFHLMNKTDQQINDIIRQMKQLGVKKCGATHCTGDKQIQMFREAFGENFVALGVGRIIIF